MAKKALSQKANADVVVVIGTDEATVKQHAAELAVQMSPAEGDEFSVEVVDGTAENADQACSRVAEAIQALQTMPFFGGEKLVWLKNVNFAGDGVTGRASSVQVALEDLLKTLGGDLGSGTRFLMSASPVDRRRSFYKGLPKVATLREYDAIDTSKSGWEQAAAELALEEAAKLDLRFDANAMDFFISRTGGDARQIRNELEKLSLCVENDGRVDEAMVKEMVPQSRAGIIFELSNAIAAKDLTLALDTVDQLLHQGDTAVAILLVAVIPTIRNLLVVSDLMKRHKLRRPSAPFYFGSDLKRLPESALHHLPRKKDGSFNAYTLGLAAMHASRFDPARLEDALAACLEANTTLVTSGLDPKVVLNRLLVQCLT